MPANRPSANVSFVLERDKPTELGRNYNGPVAVVEFEFSFVFTSGLFGGSAIAELEFYVQTGIFSLSIAPQVRNNILGYFIWRDTVPFIDRYRVQVHVAGEAENEGSGSIGPFFNRTQLGAMPEAIMIPVLLLLVVAVGIAGIFAVIAWRIFNLSDTTFSFLVLGLGALLVGGVVYVVGGRTKAVKKAVEARP